MKDKPNISLPRVRRRRNGSCRGRPEKGVGIRLTLAVSKKKPQHAGAMQLSLCDVLLVTVTADGRVHSVPFHIIEKRSGMLVDPGVPIVAVKPTSLLPFVRFGHVQPEVPFELGPAESDVMKVQINAEAIDQACCEGGKCRS